MIRRQIKEPAAQQRGQGMSEYIIITALVAVAGFGLFVAFGATLQNQMAGIQDAQSSATTGQNRATQADSLATCNQQTNAGGGGNP